MQKLFLIGASTGGPGHINKIVKTLNEETQSSFVIAQHMNKNLVGSFAQQLKDHTTLDVVLVIQNTKINPATIYVCSSSSEIYNKNGELYLKISSQESLYSPSVNILFQSAMNITQDNEIVAILLTGIGDDGAQGILTLYKKGAFCIAESEESAIVYGMPKQAYVLNPNIAQMNLNKIVRYLKNV